MKTFKLALVFLLVFGIQSQALAYYNYSYNRTANQELSQVTDLDGNSISGFNVNYSLNNSYSSGQCYDTVNHVYYDCGNSNSNNYNYNNNYNSNYNYTPITGNQCYDNVNHVYYNCSNSNSNTNSTNNNQCYDTYNHVYYNCGSTSSTSSNSSICYDYVNQNYNYCNNVNSASTQCYDNINHTYYNCSYANSSITQCYDTYNHTYYNCGTNANTSTMKIVYIQNNTLSPTTITIRKGSYVKWVNRDTIGHRILGDYSEYKFDSGMLYQNYTYTKVFSTTGTYTYHDANTSGINGTIIVTN